MISEQMQQAFNDQINAELYSAYLYASMSAYYQSVNLPGFASWMRIQVQEEMLHATFMFDFVLARGGRLTLQPIAGPLAEWPNPRQPFVDAYTHETLVTQRIDNLVNLAVAERDHASTAFLQWFITEQVEEEANADKVVKQMQFAGEGSGLFMIDRDLATRIFTPPVNPPIGG